MNLKKIERYFWKINPLNFKDDEKIKQIIKLERGESNINFLIKTTKNEYVMRFDLVDDGQRFKQEYKILKKIEDFNISQKPLFIDLSKKYFKDNIMILSYIRGKSLDKLNKRTYIPHYNRLAKKLADLHKLKLNFENKIYSFNKRLIRTEGIIRKLKRELKDFNEKKILFQLIEIYQKHLKTSLKKYKPKLFFCHGDVCLGNVLFNKNEFFLIDWELAGDLDPAIEISYIFYEFPFTEKQKKDFLKEYLTFRRDTTLLKRMQFADFFLAFSGYFDILHTCFNIAKKRGHKEFLLNADFDEYWKWGEYYLNFVKKLNLFNKDFENKLKKDLNKLYKKIK